MTLKEIALELLEKYNDDERTLIWDRTDRTEKHFKQLEDEVAEYKEMIEKAETE